MDTEAKRSFLRDHHHVVLVTHRSDGRLQTSPVVAAIDDDGFVVVSVSEDRAKTKNMRRDPRVALCVLSDEFFGAWVHIDGTAEIVPVPEALPGLRDLYRRVSGEHPDWADYDASMLRDHRCIVRIRIDDAPGA